MIMNTGPVFIVDEDYDDHEIVRNLFLELQLHNEVVFFTNGQELLDHLAEINAAPFIIICNVNLPQMNGFELRKKILNTHSRKFNSVPFIYWSAYASEAQIEEAYQLCAHGFFIKEPSLNALKESFNHIINYWTKSKMPDKSDKRGRTEEKVNA
jgi:CheY-like chemotaxis protein